MQQVNNDDYITEVEDATIAKYMNECHRPLRPCGEHNLTEDQRA